MEGGSEQAKGTAGGRSGVENQSDLLGTLSNSGEPKPQIQMGWEEMPGEVSRVRLRGLGFILHRGVHDQF